MVVFQDENAFKRKVEFAWQIAFRNKGKKQCACCCINVYLFICMNALNTNALEGGRNSDSG